MHQHLELFLSELHNQNGNSEKFVGDKFFSDSSNMILVLSELIDSATKNNAQPWLINLACLVQHELICSHYERGLITSVRCLLWVIGQLTESAQLSHATLKQLN